MAEHIQFSKLLSLLCSSSSSSSGGDRRKCSLRVLDTVFVSKESLSTSAPAWFYTTKSGAVARKKGDGAALSGVLDRFSRFSLANPANVSKTIGVFVHGNGYRQMLSEQGLKDLIETNVNAMTQDGSFLQVYLRPCKGEDVLVTCTATKTKKGSRGGSGVGLEYHKIRPMGQKEKLKDANVIDQIGKFTLELISFLKETRGMAITDAQVEFILDDNDHVWLTSVSRCSVIPVDENEEEGNEEEDDAEAEEEEDEENQHLVEGAKDRKQAAASSLSSSSNHLPSLKPTNTTESAVDRISSSSEGARPSSSTSRANILLGGEILQKEGNAFCCAFGPDDLPGLRAWALISVSGGGNELKWAIDLSEYDPSLLLSSNPAVEAVRRQRAEARFKIPLLLVVVLRYADRLLLGKEEVKGAEGFEAAWQVAYAQAQKMADLSSEVVVCGNTHAICRKLESLCKIEFRGSKVDPSSFSAKHVPTNGGGGMGGLPLGQVRPQSESAGGSARASSSGSTGTGVGGGGGGNRGKKGKDIEGGTGRRVHSAGRQDGIDSFGVPLQGGRTAFAEPAHAVADNAFFNTDMASVPIGDASSSTRALGDVAMVKPCKKNGQDGGGGKKKKGKATTGGGSGFRRDMEEPPSVELIAKFAAEKERQQRALRQQQLEAQRQAAFQEMENNDAFYGDEDEFGEADDQEWPERVTKIKQKVPKRKNEGGKGKKNQNFNSFEDEERRLAKLERMASLPQQQQNWGGGGYNPSGSFANSVISGSEADFMVRHAQNGDVGAMSGFPTEIIAGGIGGVGMGLDQMSVLSNGSMAIMDKVENSLRDRIAALEKQVASLNQSNDKKDQELDRIEEKLRRTNVEFDNSRKAAMTEITRLKEEHEMNTIRLREQHAKQMSAIALQENTHDGNIGGGGGGGGGHVSPSKYESNRALLEQLEILRAEQRNQLKEHSEERRIMQAEASTKLLTQERQFKAEIVDLRNRVTLLEDDVTRAEEESSVARAKADSLQIMCKQLEQARLDAVENQTRLRSDLKNMQQSVNAAYRLESAQNLNVGVDADTQIRLNEAKTEAKTRQLLNKVEFLKSQLAAEQASGEELRAVVDGNRAKIDEMRDEFRARLQEIEANKVAAIEDAERRTAVQYESRMAELTTLQTKMMMIQGQLQDAFQDGAVLKQREEAAKLAAAKAQSAQSVLRAEIDQLRTQLLEAREEKDLVQSQSGNKQANDAIVRRLDNERQYLKSQLASEITHKNEMQNALAQCQHQLNEVQRQWKQDVESLRETAQKDTQEAIGREQRLQQTNIALEGEVSRFESSNKDLKEAFVKMRDQVRMEQLAMENANSVNRRLQEQLDMTRTDLSRLRQVEEQSADAHRQQIAALKSAMAEGEARKVKETNRLKEELSTQYLLYSVAQKETLTVRNQFQDEKKAIARQNGALRIVTSLKHWQLARLACALRTWSTNTTLVGVAAQFRGHVNDLMKDTLAEVRSEKEAALEALRAEMNREHDTHLEEIQTEFERVHQQVRVDTEEEKNVALERQQEEFQRHLQECEAKWQYEVDAAVALGEDKVLRAVQQSDVRLSEILARNKLDNEGAMEACQREALEAQERAIQSTVQEWTIKLEVREKELHELHSRAIIELMAENTVHERAAAKAAKEERAALSKQMEDERNAALDQAYAEFEVKMEAMREKMLAEQATAIENVRDDYEDIMRNARQEQFEANEQRVRELRAAWVEESNEAMLAKDKAFEEGLQEKMDAHAKVVEAERLRGIKLESSKWRQALKDAEHRFELEVGKAKAEGRAERDKEAKAEMVQVEANHAFAMQLAKAEHEKATLELNNEHEAAMKEEKRIRDMEKLEAMRKSEAMTKEALDREFGDRMKKAVDDAWDDSAKMWQAKLQKEEERLEKFKRDVAAQQQLLAAERNELQERVNQSDELMKRIESLSQSEMNQMRKDFDAERTMLELKFSKAQKSALKDLAKEQNETLENVEAKYKDISDRRIRAEKTKMEEEMNKQISQLQFESEGLITGLEKAVADLKDEKTALNSELEKTATKLEDTEDSLYDLQQEMKKKDKEHSISHWRILTNVEKMRSRFQAGMLEFDREAAEREGKMKENFQKNLNEATLSVLKLASLLCEVETSRKKAHAVLLNYKSDELIEKRTLIRVLEKDLERLTMEKDSLEEQRDLMEEEIEALEGQVRELEEQIRDHSRTSSMQNGRVNVAHARKKRRLDSDLERVLETIEQKRINMGEMDERAADKARARDEKEAEMVDLEKQLVGILVSQQRQVLARIEEMRGAAEDKARLVMHIARLPWPPPETPTMSDVLELVEKDAAGREAGDK